SISFNQLHKADGSRIKQMIYCAAEDKPIPRSEIVKGFEYEKDRYVVVEDEEIKKVAPVTAKVMEIQEFVKSDQVDPIYLETSYYMAPDEAGEKPYALLFEALKATGFVGVAKIAMHNREHIVILRPGPKGILLHTMYYPDEIRQVEEFRTDTSIVKPKELEMAKMLIDSLLAAFEPDKYKDDYRENLMGMIKARVEGRQIVETVETKHKAPVVDILEALKMSLAEVKKPIRSSTGTPALPVEEEPIQPKKGRKAGG
ncbi:MAG TPA: Ku protein, partial [Verrucomicrobiae bacterium]|nr:Ku protein [Verrucomicrobiae bacterium]